MATVEELQEKVTALTTALQKRDAELASQRQIEADRATAALKLKKAEVEAECLRIAHNTLMENKRSLPVQERNITAEEITQMKEILLSSVSSLN